ncbi:hypothetical protein D3C71_1744900 [compost metagenome]
MIFSPLDDVFCNPLRGKSPDKQVPYLARMELIPDNLKGQVAGLPWRYGQNVAGSAPGLF